MVLHRPVELARLIRTFRCAGGNGECIRPLPSRLGLFFVRRTLLRWILAWLLARLYFLLLCSMLLSELLGLLRVALLYLLFLSLAGVWLSHLLVLAFLLLLKPLMFLILFGS